MRRQFYESRGEEVPEGMEAGDVSECFATISSSASHDAVTTRKVQGRGQPVFPLRWSMLILVDDEHARALEEQWIEGDLTAETAMSELPDRISPSP
jgi:hypothetical protein